MQVSVDYTVRRSPMRSSREVPSPTANANCGSVRDIPSSFGVDDRRRRIPIIGSIDGTIRPGTTLANESTSESFNAQESWYGRSSSRPSEFRESLRTLQVSLRIIP
jgi:hypothetical protein